MKLMRSDNNSFHCTGCSTLVNRTTPVPSREGICIANASCRVSLPGGGGIHSGIEILLRPMLVLMACMFLTGCATRQTAPAKVAPRDDVTEFRKVVVESLKTTKAALESLDAVGVQASADPSAAVQIFAGDVQKLEVESIRMRSRALAMERDGEAYFAEWHKKLAAHPDESVRGSAARNREQLKQSFSAMHATSLQLRAALKLFLSNLRQARNVLEASPNLAGVDSAKPLILASHQTGRDVQAQLSSLLAELNSISALLNSSSKP